MVQQLLKKKLVKKQGEKSEETVATRDILPIFILTGNLPYNEFSEEFKNTNFDRYLQKPLSQNVVLRTLNFCGIT
jgi:hypothetical protein